MALQVRVVLLLLVLLALVLAGRVRATRYASGDDILVDAKRRLFLAYIVKERDILVKMACICMPQRHCGVHGDSVRLSE